MTWSPQRQRDRNDLCRADRFYVSGVWNNLQAARLNAEQEANNLVNIFRFANQLPPQSQSSIQELSRAAIARP